MATPLGPDHLATASWDAIETQYDALATCPLDAATVDLWLAEWSALEERLDEAASEATIAYAANTADAAAETRHRLLSSEVGPKREAQRVRLAARVLALDLNRPDLATLLRRFQVWRDLFQPEQAPLHQRLADLEADYQKLTGGMTSTWEGEEVPLPSLYPRLLDPDRAVRERAFRARMEPVVVQRAALASILDEQIALRQELAHTAGFANYRDYVWRERERFDYTPADCLTFHDAIAATVVPVLARLADRRRRTLGLETLRPWDTELDPLGRPPLRPFATVTELVDRTQAMVAAVDPTLGGYVATMAREDLLDLDSRPHKAAMGFCTVLPVRRRPFIFLHESAMAGTVEALLHEIGHAVHAFEVFALPLSFQRWQGAEMGELAAMTMELLAAPFLEQSRGGFYDATDARRARADQLERILSGLAWIAVVDAFQHWLYTDEAGRDREARDAAWSRLVARFMPGADWTGLTAEQAATRDRQMHLFLFPFYYIEYGIAQVGALQIWRASRADPVAAVAAYRRGLALGGTRTLPELFVAAGARLDFSPEMLADLVASVEAELEQLEEPHVRS